MTDIATSPLRLALAPRFAIGRTLSLSFAVLWRTFAIGLSVMSLQMVIEEYVVAAADNLLGAGVSILRVFD